MNNVIFQLRKVEKEEQFKLKADEGKQIEIRTKIIKWETKTLEAKKTKCLIFGKISKISKS